MHLVNGTGNSPSPGGSVETTKPRSDPQRIGMCSGERLICSANGKQTSTMATPLLAAPLPPRPFQILQSLLNALPERGGLVQTVILHKVLWCEWPTVAALSLIPRLVRRLSGGLLNGWPWVQVGAHLQIPFAFLSWKPPPPQGMH